MSEVFCYILECSDGSFYTGWTTDPIRREKQHNAGKGAAYTRMHRPVHLVFIEPQEDRSTAIRRERRIKKLTHQQKSVLAQTWSDTQSKEKETNECD
ncbi:MAG TPA: GIY-YIG nuclease family protein [Longilinea sp.]|nr:GIY-YIG nuclease family protein [Longilinea sp.]